MKHLRGHVGYFTEKGGTIVWYADKKNSAIVDTQFPEQINHLISEFKKFTNPSIEAVFNTHHHGDHTSGNISLKPFAQKIIAHANSKINQERSAKQKNNLNDVALPTLVFDKELTEKVGEETIHCSYFGRGHTNGDAVIHFQHSNIAHIGDLLFNRRFPYIDMGAGASIKLWHETLESIKSYYDHETMFICGHAAEGYDVVVNKNDISAFQNYLEKLLAFGEKAISEGRTLEEVKASTKTIPGAEEWKGDGISRSLDAVYVELNPK
jgi:glyoxylase-like metal-dependent hydrolase (beta-lactamase superfamily II)